MKKQITIILTLIIIAGFMSCKKTDNTPPTPPLEQPPLEPSFSGCRVDKIGTTKGTDIYNYKSDGTISSISYNENCVNAFCNSNLTDYFYNNGLLVSSKYKKATEYYEYTNGALSKIKIADPDDSNYTDYIITVETDNNKRIVKMKDNKGIQTDIKRDNNGNITETKTVRLSDSTELYRAELSRYDNKKTVFELYKGWSFDYNQYYADYMKNPFFTIGASGNPLNFKWYRNKILTSDTDFTFDYSTEGYPVREEQLNKITNVKIVINYTYKNCK
jgi:hypothetical protein